MKLAKPALITSFATLISKISGMVRDIFLASFLGTGILSDIFLIALKLPMSFRRSVSEETFNSAYIPLFGKYESDPNSDKKYQFARKILLVSIYIFVPFVIIIEIFMPSVLKIVSSGITNPNDFRLLVQISRIIFPYLIFIALSSVFIGTLNAKNKFALGAGIQIILNLTISIFIAISLYINHSNVVLLAWSVIVGGIIQSIVLIYATGMDFWPVFFTLKRNLFSINDFFKLIWPTFMSSSLVQLNMIIVLLLASYETGAITFLYYAERVYFLPLSLIAIALSTVLIPNLSKASRTNNKTLAINTQIQAFKYCILSVIPITFCLIILSRDIVELLFQRGRFDIESTIYTSYALQVFLIGLPFATLVKILTPYFFSIEKPRVPLKVSLYSVAINLFLIVILFKIFGYIGIPIGFSIASFFNFILLLSEHKKHNFFIFDSNIFKYVVNYVFLAIFLSAVLLILNNYQITTHILLVDVSFKILIVSIFWGFSIYFFDRRTFGY